MDTKKINKSIGRFFGWFGLTFCSLIVKITPWRFIYGLAGGFAFLGYRLAVRQRKIALESLSIAFDKAKSRQEIELIAKGCFLDMAKSGIEMLFFMDRPELLKKRVTYKGLDHLESGLKKGKGVILCSAHFGNFPLLMAKLALEGYNIGGIMRHMRDSRVEEILSKKRARLNVKTIYSQPRDACVNQTIQMLRDNGLVFIPLDQNFGTAGVFVDFFGQKAATATGPVVFAQRTGATLLPCFIIRQPGDIHQIVFEPPIDLEVESGSQETVAHNVQKITSIIERYIKNYPQQWGWIHRRWKSRPAKEIT
jgi:Kdo2-lipid IVA lauroyltransferase/acyltransferase